MEPLPTWLEDTIAAAGITAYAFDMDPEASAPSMPLIPVPLALMPPPLF